jgi:hypothetical protein
MGRGWSACTKRTPVAWESSLRAAEHERGLACAAGRQAGYESSLRAAGKASEGLIVTARRLADRPCEMDCFVAARLEMTALRQAPRPRPPGCQAIHARRLDRRGGVCLSKPLGLRRKLRRQPHSGCPAACGLRRLAMTAGSIRHCESAYRRILDPRGKPPGGFNCWAYFPLQGRLFW